MTIVKLNLISAKVQQTAGKSGKSEREDNDLFTEVFSTMLSGSRTTTGADDRSSSAAKNNIEGTGKNAGQADYVDSNLIETDQIDLQEAAEPEDESAEKTAMVPAWLLIQLKQESGNCGLNDSASEINVVPETDSNINTSIIGEQLFNEAAMVTEENEGQQRRDDLLTEWID